MLTFKKTFRKSILLLLIAISFYSNVRAQRPTFRAVFLNPNVYRTRIDLTAIRVSNKDLSKIYYDTFKIKVKNGYIDYKIINEDENGFAIIEILPNVSFTVDKSKSILDGELSLHNGKLYRNDTLNAYNYYFAIKKDAFKPLSKTLLSNKIIGTPLVHPFKLRPSKGDEGWNLNGEFTLSYNFGLRFKIGNNPFTQNYLTIIGLGTGISAAKYFKQNQDGTLTDKKDSFALTYYQYGLMLTLQKVNFGVFNGFDLMVGDQKDWYYQNEPWYSFGIGYKFKND